MCCESKKCDYWGRSTCSPSAGRQAVRGSPSAPPPRPQEKQGLGPGQLQKLAWLTGPGGVGPGQSCTPWMLCERLLKRRQLMAPETEHQKGTDAKPRKARFMKDGRRPLGSAGRVRSGWLWDPARPSRLQRSTQEAHESSWAEGLDTGAAGISSRSALWSTTTAPKPPPPPLDPHPVTSPHHGTADGRRGEGLLSASWPPALHFEKGVLGTAASASSAASPPLCSTGKVSGHLWASPTPAPAAAGARDASAPGTRLNLGSLRCAGERGRRAGPGRQAAPPALEHRLSRPDCGLRRAPATGQFGLLRRQAGYLRPPAQQMPQT
ncbi:lymphocyte antigen 6E isoform X2 [Odocoileus virginianus]|uniref:Lymphocyte antigen 6E isoform X2 n=1 Tax=Odocoileus virginianus TaxID=9874 RepID=A0ABM4HYA4_ODOVR